MAPVEHRRQAPAPTRIEIVTTLETVLKKSNNIGANHYYIHAVEASRPIPRARWRALIASARWRPAPAASVHMPSHIYIRTGRFHEAAETNANAIKADQAFFAESKEDGVYPLMYYTHNVHFLCYAQMIEGRRARRARERPPAGDQGAAGGSARDAEWPSSWSRCRTWSTPASACGIRF